MFFAPDGNLLYSSAGEDPTTRSSLCGVWIREKLDLGLPRDNPQRTHAACLPFASVSSRSPVPEPRWTDEHFLVESLTALSLDCRSLNGTPRKRPVDPERVKWRRTVAESFLRKTYSKSGILLLQLFISLSKQRLQRAGKSRIPLARMRTGQLYVVGVYVVSACEFDELRAVLAVLLDLRRRKMGGRRTFKISNSRFTSS